MPTDPRRVKELFLAALDLPEPADRPAFLDRECGDDGELRHRLDDLLAAHDQPASELERPIAASLQATASPDDPDRMAGDPGAPTVARTPTAFEGRTASVRPDDPPAASLIGVVVAGRYKIRQEIGEGGMGSVYLAEQVQPVKRMVALKLIKAGMDTRTVLARFDSERQALALMDHPNIAKVLDAGMTDAGRPFFVMELVKGVPITLYCDRHRLALPERLALFRQVCSAVQHAHQKGIIHRDLKPSNILVEAHDDKPVPRVIDFGLAKATSGLKLTEQSLFTAFGGVAGTPLYMAPEQAAFNAVDIDTRADIYALGVILYELLTGSTPIRRETFRDAALDEMLRVIREVEPPTPSSRLGSSDALPSVAANRHIEPSRLTRFVRGDLDWIVMKALAKERRRRYDSAVGLANDLERFANHEPVSAGPPTTAYRLRKFIRRNRGRVIAASLVFLALVGGIIGTTLGLFEANRQRGIADARLADATEQRGIAEGRRKEAEKRLAQKDKANEILLSIFKDLNTDDAETAPLPARLAQRLDVATAGLEGDATDDPLGVARMQVALADTQLSLGFAERSIELCTRARATLTARLGPDHFDTLKSMRVLAVGYQDVGKNDLALPPYEETVKLMKAKLGPDHLETLKAMNGLGVCYRRDGKNDLAMQLYEETLKFRRAKLGPDHPDTLKTMHNLAVAYQFANRLDLALPLYEETLALKKAKLGPDHFQTLATMGNLGAGYRDAGKLDLALPLLEETLKLEKAKLGPDHPGTFNTMTKLAIGYQDAGKLDRALSLYEETLALHKAKFGANNPRTLSSMVDLALGYRAAGRPDRALPILVEAISLWKRQAGANSSGYATALGQLGLVQLESGMWSQAEATLRECLAIQESRQPDLWSTFSTRSALGGALLGQKRYDEAEPLLRAGYEGMTRRADKISPRNRARLVEALDRLIELAEATGKPDEAKAWRDEKGKLAAKATTPKPTEENR